MSSPAKIDPLAGIRHELRTPLNQILGYAEMLLEDAQAGADDSLAAGVKSIHNAARELLRQINCTLAPGADESAVAKLRGQMRVPVAALLGDVDALTGVPGEEQRADIARIRSAAGRLLEFAEQEAAAAPTAPPAEDRPPAPERRDNLAATGHVLVVDDSEGNRDVLERRLVRQGYRVSLAENGYQALEMVRRGNFDLVLLDIMMPGLNGLQVLSEIKSDAALRDLPVIMISALDEFESVVRSIEMGAEDFLAKPFDPVLLRARIGASLEKKRLRDQLMVQEKLASLGALTAGIAHEIRNPLNFVTNFAELAVELVGELRQDLGGETRAGVTDVLSDLEKNAIKIREHGQRAEGIVKSMLMHSRGQAGERQPADLNALVEDNVRLAYHSMRAQNASFNVAIETDYDPAVGVVSMVPQDVGRVVLNIAGNAYYAVHQKKLSAGEAFQPTVSVSTRNVAGRPEIRIRDNGNGIPKAAREKIFAPFFTTKPAGSGTGLGLSISYDIVVREHSGELRVESVEGEFAEFTVLLPSAEGGACR